MTRRYQHRLVRQRPGLWTKRSAEVWASFDRLCLAAGIEALGTMMEADVTAAYGPAPRSRRGAASAPLGRNAGRIGFPRRKDSRSAPASSGA